MIDFMVLGLPRSGTAWLANLFTTDISICLHESLLDFSIEQLDSLDSDVSLGISETSAIFFPEAVNHPCKKLIVDRSIIDINKSLNELGLPEMPESAVHLLSGIEGYKITFKELFDYDAMRKAYKFLLDKDLSQQRHAFLCQMNVQNQRAIDVVKRMF